MIKIAICDDEQEYVDALKKYIKELVKDKNVQYEIVNYNSSVEAQEKSDTAIDENVIFFLTNKKRIKDSNILAQDFEYSGNAQIDMPFVGGNKKIEIDNIVYIESIAHKLIFYVIGYDRKEYYTYLKLSEVERMLKDYKFIRIHQSFLVNVNYIKDFYEKSVELLTVNKNLPVSRTRSLEAKKKFDIFKEK